MTFRLAQRDSVSPGLRRLGRKEVRAALGFVRRTEALTPAAVHALRKRMKHVRALLRLLEEDGGGGLRSSRRRLRDACLPLSPIRDLDVVRTTLLDLTRLDARVLAVQTKNDLLARMRHQRRLLMRSYRRDDLGPNIEKALKQVSTRIDRWRPDDRGIAILLPGLQRSHERCRAALRRVTREGRDADYHEWRKDVTTLRNQLMLIAERSPAVQADVQALDTAAHALGEDHNLVVLRDTLSSWAAEEGTALHPRFIRLIASRQRELREAALGSAGALCRRASKEFVRGVEEAWAKG